MDLSTKIALMGGVLLLLSCSSLEDKIRRAIDDTPNSDNSSVSDTEADSDQTGDSPLGSSVRNAIINFDAENISESIPADSTDHWGAQLSSNGDAFSVWFTKPQDKNVFEDTWWDTQQPIIAEYLGEAKGFAYQDNYTDEFEAKVYLDAVSTAGEIDIKGWIKDFSFTGDNSPDISKWAAALELGPTLGLVRTRQLTQNDLDADLVDIDGIDAIDFDFGNAATLQKGSWDLKAWTSETSIGSSPEGITGYIDLTFEDGRAVGAYNTERVVDGER